MGLFGSKKDHKGSLYSSDYVSDDYKKKKAAKEKAEREKAKKEEEERKKKEKEKRQREMDESVRLGNGSKNSKSSSGGGFYGSGW